MFTEEAKQKLDAIVKKYPTKKAALLPALWLAQEENDGWIPRESMKEIADILGLAPAEVEGVATFYTMYNKAPIGKYHLEVCHNIVCMAVGADALIDHIGEKLGIDLSRRPTMVKIPARTVRTMSRINPRRKLYITVPSLPG